MRAVSLGHDLAWDPGMSYQPRWTCRIRTCRATVVVPPGQSGFGTALTTGCVQRQDRPPLPRFVVDVPAVRFRQAGITACHQDGTPCRHQVNSRGKPQGEDRWECDGRTGYGSQCACGLGCRGSREVTATWKRQHAAAHQTGGPQAVDHAAQVQHEQGGFRAVCLCGASWAGRTEAGCELEATKHLRTATRTIRWKITPAYQVEQPW
jgi:hypothetical protein